MGNSSLVTYTKLSPNKTNGRKSITGIAIHCMAGNLTVERCGALFANKKTQASSNYGVSGKGIGLYVEESNRSWCTCSSDVDANCITIEVANNTGAPAWGVSTESLKTLITLCADICKRNNFRLRWDAALVASCDIKFAELRKKHKYTSATDKADRKAAYSALYNPSATHNMPLHRWVSNKACPGNTLVSYMPFICKKTNYLLDGGDINSIIYPTAEPTVNTKVNAQAGANGASMTTTITYVYGGVNLAPVFNPEYYSNKYADIKAAFGTDAKLLFEHFCKHGMSEARQGNADFNPIVYRKNNPDVVAKYNDNWLGYYAHYCTFGINEGRVCK